MKTLVLVALLAAGSAAAQHATHKSPYAGHEGREVKALSAAHVADLRAGRGMGLALGAELNGYPGPLHVLELSDALGLGPEQRRRVEELFAAMPREASALGSEIVEREAALDRLFASRAAEPHAVAELVAAIAERQGSLRYTHLKYHVAMMEVLTPAQVPRYPALRGHASHRHD